MDEANRNIETLAGKLKQADEVIDKIGNENNQLKREVSRARESGNQERSSYPANNGFSGSSYGSVKVDRTEVNRLENEVRNLRDQLGEKQQRIRDLEDELSRRPTK